MKTLLVLRHAKSSWSEGGLSDYDRPLNKRGQRDAPRMGKLLAEENLVPDAIVSSSAVRARTTSEAVAVASGFGGEIELVDDLYGSGVGDYVASLAARPDDERRVLIVGHNPTVEDLIERLTGEDERMPTAALAHITVPIDRWEELAPVNYATLVHVWRPKELSD